MTDDVRFDASVPDIHAPYRAASDRYTHLAARYADLRLRQLPTAVEAVGDRVRVRTRDADGGTHALTADLVRNGAMAGSGLWASCYFRGAI